MDRFLYFLLGVLATIATGLTMMLGNQMGVLPMPSAHPSGATSVSAAPAPKLVAKPSTVTPAHRPTHHPRPKHTSGPAGTPGPGFAYCKDGHTTHSAGKRGACSGHGGLR